MRLLAVILTGCFYLYHLQTVHCQEISIIRHTDGDVFTNQGSCTDACILFTSGTANLYSENPYTTRGLVVPQNNNTCICQCNANLPTFREDLNICVNDIHECKIAGFVSSTGQAEKVPYVFLPQRGQIIYPHAEIKFENVAIPVCGIAGSQQLGKSGWYELRNLSDTEPPFRLFRDEGKTFLQWVGDAGLRDATEGKVVMVKLVCRDASPESSVPNVFTPCVAFRVAGSPSRNNIREIMFSSTSQVDHGLSTVEYTAIGISSVILALIYVASVSLYLHSRKTKRKIGEQPESGLTVVNRETTTGLVKNNPLLAASKHFESDTNSALTESDLGDDFQPNDGDLQGFDQVTSAVVHPYCFYLDQSEGPFGTGSILGERLPDEDVRIVETIDSQHQQDVSMLPGTQRKKLYFNPAYFDRQLLLAPPPAAIDFLHKIREVISIAKHKMAAKKFVPTLDGIREENVSEGCSSTDKISRPTASSPTTQGSTTQSKKYQKCTGCPGCRESPKPLLPPGTTMDHSNVGENKVRAWLEDIKPSQPSLPSYYYHQQHHHHHHRHRHHRFHHPHSVINEMNKQKLDPIPNQIPTFTKNLEYLRQLTESRSKDRQANMLKNYRNVARSEILGNSNNDDCRSVSARSTKSMFEQSYNYESSRNSTISQFNGIEIMNAQVRKVIESSFVKQMEGTPATIETRSSTVPEAPSKRIMDAVIQEMLVVKGLNDRYDPPKINNDFETDSLERMKRINANKNGVILDIRIKDSDQVVSQRSDSCYSLVSEVYVNDGYASPGSDDSGPEIQYASEKPGHLTIKVQDSPENYVKLEESEYEPDTLDRKPMRLKINGDVHYELEPSLIETYVDSLERPASILLKSKGSFRKDENTDEKETFKQGYASLREIYEARLKLNNDSCYLTPDTKQAKRQRKPINQPDVVPLPPMENVYEQPKPPRMIESCQENQTDTKNGWGRSPVETVDPTAGSNGTPVPLNNISHVTVVGDNDKMKKNQPSFVQKLPTTSLSKKYTNDHRRLIKVEDSGYLSSTDSNGSRKQLLKHEVNSVSETDETESMCDGASESGAESIGTDSVFYGNFRKVHEIGKVYASNRGVKSIDSGVESVGASRANLFSQQSVQEKLSNLSICSDNETESSLVTVLPSDSRRNSLAL